MTAESPRPREAIRLQRYLSRAGVASRREAERLITQGRVSVDGTVVSELGARVVPGDQVVRVDSRRVEPRAPCWIAVYKPAGYLTTRRDERGRSTVYSLLPAGLEHLFHVGRLDRSSEGLVIFTNEGETAHRLLHPKYRTPRRYRVEVEGTVAATELHRLREGLELEDGVAPAEDVEVAPSRGGSRRGAAAVSIVYLTLREGRKREVRRMMAALELPVKRLVRLSFGPVELGELEPGDWRELSAEEVGALREAVGTGEPHGDT
ncbi:MAG: hypothetical protein AMS25_06375 [Gemmatimonas sp. SM23_52]|nr:MAG: hypothetical protein AMS25_06375 [Gemmatimonas sp. SM23_52]